MRGKCTILSEVAKIDPVHLVIDDFKSDLDKLYFIFC